ncbi:MAG: hypothetical protein PHR16_03435 [Methylovulum sp.]|nr:hypothetical protein [Methylovulum sp.]
MSKKPATSIAVALSLVFLAFFCPGVSVSKNRLDNFPPVILWAWERPEDLRFLDSRRFGVAFLAQTLQLTGDKLLFAPRQQPLGVAPEIRLIAVTRIEAIPPTALSEAQRNEAIRLVLQTLALKNVEAVQIDFDAKLSERVFYRGLLGALRARLPKPIPLSITALASFCIGDSWISDLPVDEAVPMVFRMGKDAKRVKQYLKDGNDFPVPLCRHSYGVATDEPLADNFVGQRRKYVFKGRPEGWKPSDMDNLK